MAIAQGPVRFRKWLQRKHPSEVVGYSGSFDDNPIARFLRRRGVKHVEVASVSLFPVDNSGFLDHSAGLYFPMPEWACRFNLALDVVGDPFTSKPIQARTALKVLREVEAELREAA